ncbi:hypothetical protein CRG98_008770 [Punica granatum]|uniref:Uncharacterized protein n=1 Tax=Punica granatum TaxID=22663 RepID=A0A2I0KQY1_PUNGR|nr:hypothetical protein CRG98_008770 [Punica granatum]
MGWALARFGLAFARGAESSLGFTRVWAESGIAESARFHDSAIHGLIHLEFQSFRLSSLYRKRINPRDDSTIRITILKTMGLSVLYNLLGYFGLGECKRVRGRGQKDWGKRRLPSGCPWVPRPNRRNQEKARVSIGRPFEGRGSN